MLTLLARRGSDRLLRDEVDHLRYVGVSVGEPPVHVPAKYGSSGRQEEEDDDDGEEEDDGDGG